MTKERFEEIVIKHFGKDFRHHTIYGDVVDECLLELKTELTEAKARSTVEAGVSLRAVFEKIISIVNEGKCFIITDDMGDNTLTIEINGHHTHCGIPDGTLDDLIDSLYGTLIIGKGLSWK